MPQISSFYGLIIMMNFKDHAPPHFHAWYGEYKVSVSIRDGVVTGSMPQRALKLVFDWLELHRDDLLLAWERAQKGEPLGRIEPLT
ncbi:MAG: DUF4160 domain-containing protein [Verrucomicrobiales bacterium]|jgi:hypothetical protein|nr:DUF4160 domain-containing protein [Verrucomicrobiales bacterium]